MDDIIGSLIAGGRYRVEEILGRGPDRSVLRVFDRRSRTSLVLKRFSSEISRGESGDMAFREFARLAGVDFPGILPVLDCGLDPGDGSFYFTCRLVRGKDFIEGTRGLPFAAFREVLGHVLRALDFLHRRGIIHGDIKPSNILVEEAGGAALPWIIDFGLARLVDEEVLAASGTFFYMAPEVLAREGAGVGADLYSLGLMVHEALFGRLPFDTSSLEAAAGARLAPRLDLSTTVPEGGPPRFIALIEKLLRRDPKQRYLSAGEVLGDLGRLGGGESPPVTRATLAGRVRSAFPPAVDEDTALILEALGIPGGGSGRPVLVSASPGTFRILAERLRFAAAAAGVRGEILSFLSGDGEADSGAGPEEEGAMEPGSRAFVESCRRFRRRVDRTLAGVFSGEDAPPSSSREGGPSRPPVLLMVLIEDREISSLEGVLDLLGSLASRASSGAFGLAVFLPPVPEGRAAAPMAREGAARWIRLEAGRLSREETERFLARLFEWDSVPGGLLDLLCPSGEKVDFHEMREMLALLVASGIIHHEMGVCRFREDRLARAGMGGLDRLLGCSLDALSAGERRVLEVLSLFQAGAPVLVVEEILPGGGSSALLSSLAERGLVVLRGDGPGRRAVLGSFALRSRLYESLPAEERKRLHAAAALALGRDPRRFPGGGEEIAVHLARSGDFERALPALLEAARARLEEGSHGRAYALADEALRMEGFSRSGEAFRILGLKAGLAAYLGRMPEALRLFDDALAAAEASGAPAAETADLLVEKAKVYVRLGEPDKEIACYDAILGLDLPEGAAGRVVRAKAKSHRGYCYFRMHRFEESLADFEESLAVIGNEPSLLRAETLNRLGQLLHDRGRFAAAEEKYREAIEIMKGAGRDDLALSPYYNLSRVLKIRGIKAEAARYMEKALDMARKKDDAVVVATLLTGLAGAFVDLGDFASSRKAALEGLNISVEIGSKRNTAFLNGTLGEIALREGDPDRAEQFFDRCEAVWRELGDERWVSKVFLLRAEKAMRLGLLDEARSWFDRARSLAADEATGLDALRLARTEGGLLLAEERFEEAALAAERGLAGAGETEPNEWTFELGLVRARALCAAGRGAESLEAAGELSRSLPEGVSLHFEASTALVRCAALRILGRPDEKALREILSRLEGSGLKDLVAEARLELALTLGARCGEEPSFRELDALLEVMDGAEGAAASVRYDLLAARIAGERKKLIEGSPASGGGPELIRRFSDMERLQEITGIINSEMDLKKLLDLIVDTALELTGAVRGFIVLVRSGKLHFAAARQISEEDINDPEFEISHSIAREVALSGEPILTSNAQADDRFRDAVSISELRLLSVLCVPLKKRESVLGSLYIDNPNAVSAFDSYDLKLMGAFANQAGIALGNAELMEENLARQRELVRSKAEIERLNRALEKTVREQAAEIVVIKDSLEARQRELELKYSYDSIVTRAPAMIEVFKVLDRITPTSFPVVILGESGTGKDLVARAVHYNGPRRKKRFVSLNCAAVVEPLIESELFGSMKGAFTGADKDRPGLFEEAHKGTLFLDEIGDMSLEVQKRLLRVLQSGEFMRVGGKEVIRVDVRIVAATNKDILAMVREGTFREDLFYRLNVAVVRLPPLRERREDIPLLLEHFNRLYSREAGRAPKKFDRPAVETLIRCPWRGNVRELENVVRNLVMFDCPDDLITRDLLVPLVDQPSGGSMPPLPLKEGLDVFEKNRIVQALREAGGNKTRAAKSLGISIRGFYKKLEKHGIS